jgi:ribosomal 50S subunit-recycling heat shock protein
MRLDKFLKVSRIIKRRTLSKEIAEAERVKVNGKMAKPSTKLKINDEIEIAFGRSILKVRVKELKNQNKDWYLVEIDSGDGASVKIKL